MADEKKTKAIPVVVCLSSTSPLDMSSVQELNKLLDAGWTVRGVRPLTPAGGGASSVPAWAALVFVAEP